MASQGLLLLPKSGNEPASYFAFAASAEFIDASAWYKTNGVGPAIEFMTEIERCVSLAFEYPQQFAVVREEIRRVVANRFLTAFFCPEKHRIVVLAVFRGSRDLQFGSPENNE